jgi:hypothetical protein
MRLTTNVLVFATQLKWIIMARKIISRKSESDAFLAQAHLKTVQARP